MIVGLEGVFAKLERAREHFESLERELRDYEEVSTTKLSLDIDEAARRARIMWHCDPAPPLRLAILAGDCVHNARSALDKLICALVRRRDPSDSCGGRAFPICDERSQYPVRQQNREGTERRPNAGPFDHHRPATVAAAEHDEA